MLRVKLSVVYAGLLATTALLLVGCSTTAVDKTAGMSPNTLYSEAKGEMSTGQWEKAVPLLEKLESRAAGTPLAQQAQLDKAYAHYKSAEPAQALAALERFMKLHPASPAMDYALYLKGIINFNIWRPLTGLRPLSQSTATFLHWKKRSLFSTNLMTHWV
jgi:outer membrane protein assembly factor BamD